MAKLRRPYKYASSGVYPGVIGVTPWSGLSRQYSPTDTELADGATPNTPIAAEISNYLEGVKADALTVQNHAAITTWQRFTFAAVTGVVPRFLVAVQAPNGAGGVLLNRPKSFLISGVSGGTNQATRTSSDLRGFEVATSVAGFSPLATIAADDSGTIFGGTASTIYKQSADSGQTFSNFTPGLITALEAVYFTGTNYVAAAGGSSVTTTALGGAWSAPSLYLAGSLAIQIVGNRVDDSIASTIVILVLSAGGHPVAYQSTNNGVTWTLGQDFGTGGANITYSQSRGLWVVLHTGGELWTSSDGLAWTKQKTAADLAIVPLFARSAAIGDAIATIVNRNGAFANSMGIAYTFDLGATWYETYFGDNSGVLTLRSLIAANGRLYCCDDTYFYQCMPLESPAVPNYLGV